MVDEKTPVTTSLGVESVLAEMRRTDKMIATKKRVDSFSKDGLGNCTIPKGSKICWLETVGHGSRDALTIFYGRVKEWRIEDFTGSFRNYYVTQLIWVIEQSSLGWKYKDLRSQNKLRQPTAHQVNVCGNLPAEEFVKSQTGVELFAFIDSPNKYHGGDQDIQKKVGAGLGKSESQKAIDESYLSKLKALFDAQTERSTRKKILAIAEQLDADPSELAHNLRRAHVPVTDRLIEALGRVHCA